MKDPFIGPGDASLSPVLAPFHPHWEPREHLLLEDEYSDEEEDLYADDPWHPDLMDEDNRPTPRRPNALSTEDSLRKSSRKDRLLLSVMNGGRISNAVENQAFDESLFERFGSSKQDVAFRGTQRRRRRFVLPLNIHGQVISTCPDSGSDANIMSLTTARQLGLVLETSPIRERFSLANGLEVQSLGQITTTCSFTDLYAQKPEECTFHIFSVLAVPVIMGTGFLSATQVFTIHRSKLIAEEVASTELLSVNFLGSPRNSLVCRLHTHVACAIIDTGSDLNLVSSDFAQKLGHRVVPNHEKLQLADGSYDYTAGLITIDFSLGDVDENYRFLARSGEKQLDFHVLKSLSTDVLIGSDTVDEFAVFQMHAESFIQNISCNGLGNTNILRHIGRAESWIVEQCRKLRKGLERDSNRSAEVIENLDVQQQRENDRRERERSLLIRDEAPGLEAPAFDYSIGYESPVEHYPHETQLGYESPVEHYPHETQLGYESPVENYPHETQLDHLVHFNQRYDQGLVTAMRARAAAGLVPDAHGYGCPFCPDTSHKWARPDLLQRRHIRLHHGDKSRGDPLLQEVLAQPKTRRSSKGRRQRRVISGQSR